MSELNDSSDLHTYSTAVLYILSAVSPPIEYVEAILSHFVTTIKSTTVRLNLALHGTPTDCCPAIVVLAYTTSSAANLGGFLL
jgi:hypothetical protein